MNIEVSKTAKKFLEKLNQTQQSRIIKALYKLPDGDIKSIKGGKVTKFRLRVGDFRIIYVICNDVIIVTDMDNRGDIY